MTRSSSSGGELTAGAQPIPPPGAKKPPGTVRSRKEAALGSAMALCLGIGSPVDYRWPGNIPDPMRAAFDASPAPAAPAHGRLAPEAERDGLAPAPRARAHLGRLVPLHRRGARGHRAERADLHPHPGGLRHPGAGPRRPPPHCPRGPGQGGAPGAALAGAPAQHVSPRRAAGLLGAHRDDERGEPAVRGHRRRRLLAPSARARGAGGARGRPRSGRCSWPGRACAWAGAASMACCSSWWG